MLWSVVLLIFMPDSPVQCWYLSNREKYICVERVKRNNTGVEEKKIKLYQVRECFLDPKTWLLFFFSIAQNIPNGGLVTFSSIIVSGLGYSKLITTLLGIPTGVVATAWQIAISYIATRFTGKYKNARCVIVAVSNVITLVLCFSLACSTQRYDRADLLSVYIGMRRPHVEASSRKQARSLSGLLRLLFLYVSLYHAYYGLIIAFTS